ncbi:MAG TPA: hypothetical protein ENG51_00845 [Deltaproteobacteria bacterium]|nr:hypothetical protein [Deltaproteobacteria bacterium]
MKVEKYLVEIRGVKPLLMHAPVNLGDNPKRRRGEHLAPEKEAEMYLYKDEKGEIVIPSLNIKAMLRDAGRNYKISGRKTTYGAMIKAGIDIEPYPYVPLNHDGWKVDIRPVVVQRSRILRARPRFDKWGLKFVVVNKDPQVLLRDTMRRIVEDAGKWIGLGDFRPEFGLFKVVRFEVKA